jgi:hypothetical protein
MGGGHALHDDVPEKETVLVHIIKENGHEKRKASSA